MRSVTEGEARERAELLADIAYEVFLDLAATPARSRTRVTFRCLRPDADTFAELDLAETGSVTLNGELLPAPDGGRVRLGGLAAQNAATVAAAQAALAGSTLPDDLRNAVAEQAAILGKVIAARSPSPSSLP